MSERGRTEKKDTRSRVTRGLRSLSARRPKLGLPKLNRARGKAAARSQKVKQKQKAKEAKRDSPPPLGERLKTVLAENQDFVLWLGEDFEPKETFNLKDILLKVANLAEDGEEKTAALALINQKPEGDDSHLAAARDSLKNLLGHARFNAVFAQFLSEVSVTEEPGNQVSFKLLRALKPKAIVYGGSDRLIEDSFQHDNLSVQSFTPLELYALKSKNNTPDEELKQVLLDTCGVDTIVIKPAGDITKPDSLFLSTAEKFGGYGFALDGNPLPEDALDVETKATIAVLKSFATDMPIVFLGQDLSIGKDPVANLLKSFHTEGDAKRHVALVATSIKNDQRFSDEEIGVVYQPYKPHSSGTQIAEFMSKMVGFHTSIPEEDPDIDAPFTAGVMTGVDAAPFISSMADKETSAKTINIFANSFEAIPFLLPDDFEEVFEKKFKVEGDEVKEGEPTFEDLIAAVNKRSAAFNGKLVPATVETEDPVVEIPTKEPAADADVPEEAPVEPTEEAPQEAAVQTDDTTRFPACVNVLLPTAAGLNAVKAARGREFRMLQKLKNIVVDSKGRLEVRFIEPISGNFLAEDFELLYLENAKADFGDMALYHKEMTEDFSVYFYENNTNASEEKVLLFERMWTQSKSAEESMELFDTYIADVSAAIEEKARKKAKKKGGLFGRSGSKTQVKKEVKKASKVSKVSAAVEDKPKKDGLIKRIVKGVTGSSRRQSKVTQAAPSASAAKEEIEAEAAQAEEPAAEGEAPAPATEEPAAEPALEPALEPVEDAPKEAATEEPKKAVEEVAPEPEAAEEEKKEEVVEKKKKKNGWKLGRAKAKEASKKKGKKEEAPAPKAEEAAEEPALEPVADETPKEQVTDEPKKADAEVEEAVEAAVEKEEAAEEKKEEAKKEKKKGGWKVGFSKNKKKEGSKKKGKKDKPAAEPEKPAAEAEEAPAEEVADKKEAAKETEAAKPAVEATTA